MMINVTEPAKEELKNILSEKNDSETRTYLRLTQTAPGQFDLISDKEQEGDHVIEHQGSKVLVIGTELVAILDGLTIDCEDSPQGPNLIMFEEVNSCNCDECQDNCSQ